MGGKDVVPFGYRILQDEIDRAKRAFHKAETTVWSTHALGQNADRLWVFTRSAISKLLSCETDFMFNRQYLITGIPSLLFSCIIVDGNLPSPTEIWTQEHIDSGCFEANVGRIVPVFRPDAVLKEQTYAFLGCYRIGRCSKHTSIHTLERLEPLAAEVPGKLGCSLLPSTRDAEASVEGMAQAQAWECVVLRTAEHPVVSGRPEHKYVVNYAVTKPLNFPVSKPEEDKMVSSASTAMDRGPLLPSPASNLLQQMSPLRSALFNNPDQVHHHLG